MGETRSRIISRSNSLPEPQRPTLRRTLGLFDGVAILIGITIGAGICSTHQIIAGYHESFYPIVALLILVVFFPWRGVCPGGLHAGGGPAGRSVAISYDRIPSEIATASGEASQ